MSDNDLVARLRGESGPVADDTLRRYLGDPEEWRLELLVAEAADTIESLRAQRDRAMEVLRELVSLADAFARSDFPSSDVMDRKPLAWQAARTLIEEGK